LTLYAASSGVDEVIKRQQFLHERPTTFDLTAAKDEDTMDHAHAHEHPHQRPPQVHERPAAGMAGAMHAHTGHASMPRWWWIFAAASKTLFSSGQSKGKLVFFLDFLSVLSSSTALGAYSEAAYSPVACSFFRTRPVIRWTTALVLPIQTFSLGSHVHGPSFLLYISLF